MIAVDVLGGVVTKTESGDQLLAGHPLLVDEGIGSKARPEKTANTGTGRQRTIPVRIEVVGIASSQVHASIAEFVLTVDLCVPDVIALCDYTAAYPPAQ